LLQALVRVIFYCSTLPLPKPHLCKVFISHLFRLFFVFIFFERVIFNCPLNLYRVLDTLDEDLVLHGFTSELCTDPVTELDVDKQLGLIKDDVLNLTPWRELVIH
jgi:hypothetical protein